MEVLTWSGLVRYQVLVVMRLATREVQIAGVVRDSAVDERWMLQVARNLTDFFDGFLHGVTHLILDRDPLYTKAFRDLLRSSGVKVVRLPARSPDLNAHVERWILGAREECLNHLILFGEAQLRRGLTQYVAHFHGERHHQGLGGRLIQPDETAGRTEGDVRCRQRLGGLPRYYYRGAA